MKIASYNLENLFLRARAFEEGNGDGKQALKDHAAINALLARPNYTTATKKKIVELMKSLGIDKKDDGGKFAILRQNRGDLVKRSNGTVTVVAEGRSSWIGWVDLKLAEVNEVATQNTARVLREVAPDVLGVVEAESRPALVKFSRFVMPAVGAASYAHAMLIDGNDDRGIDVGLMTRDGFDILRMTSHVDDVDAVGQVFSRDCPEFVVRTPQGNTVVVVVNHLKSKGFGDFAQSEAKRKRQAARAKTIYEGLVAGGFANVAVVGDMNDTPDSDALAPLLQQTNLKDISEHAAFDDGGRPGTYRNSTAANKIDYVLLSPALFNRVQAGGIYRMGVWGGVNGTLFPHLDEITKESEAASDHAAIWADIDV